MRKHSVSADPESEFSHNKCTNKAGRERNDQSVNLVVDVYDRRFHLIGKLLWYVQF